MASDRKSIFITGAASGIGRATALLFAEHGWYVGAFDVDEAGLATLATEIGPDDRHTQRLDVSDRAAYLVAMTAFAQKTGGTLDILFNNAGVIANTPTDEMAWEVIERIVRINLLGVFAGVQAAAPLLKATPNSLCFSTSSASAVFGSANLAAYSATKQAVKGLTEALAIEFKRHGVRVADVLPGIIDTGMLSAETKAMLPPDGPWRLINPRMVAETVWQAYHEDRVHWYVPPELKELHLQAISAPEATREYFIALGRG